MAQEEIRAFFGRMPPALPLYEAFAQRVRARLGDVGVRVQKTQITFRDRYAFAWAWLPPRRVRGRPDVYLVVSFGLDHRVSHPRIVEAVETRPRRWTHHVLVASEADVDDQLMDWIQQAHDFARRK